jgi:four helix bundle protein
MYLGKGNRQENDSSKFLILSFELVENTENRNPNIIKDKTYQFALNIIRLYSEMIKRNEYIISKQLIRSGTSIGANVEEAVAAQSRRDFIAKMSIASKEARETNYWLRILRDSELIIEKGLSSLINESEEIIKILTSIVKTTQSSSRINNSKLKIKD